MKNIDIRNPAIIGVANIDIYKTNDENGFSDEAKLEFYRSAKSSQGIIGAKDDEYNGEFGFDIFNEKIMPKSYLPYYKDIDGKDIKINDRPKYICSYLSIYPPKFGAKKSKVTLYIKVIDKKNKKSSGEIDFIFSNSKNDDINNNLSIVGGNKVKIESNITKTLIIQCTSAFDNDIYLDAKIGTKKIGRIIIMANSKIYQTTIQPVLINWGTTASKTVDPIEHEEFIKNLEIYFNSNSFNQSYIIGKLAEKTHSVTFLKSDFTKKDVLKEMAEETDPCGRINKGGLFVNYGNKGEFVNARNYNALVEERYAALNSNNKEKQIAKEKLDVAMKELIKVFSKDFKYDKQSNLSKAKEFHKDAVVTNIWKKQEVIDAYNNYVKLRKDYKGSVYLDHTKTIYVFINKNIEGGRDPITKTQAYSLNSSGVVHVFNSAYNDKDKYALVIHEIGHALSLQHTFSDRNSNTISENTKTIQKLENEKKELENIKKNLDLRNYYGLDKKYLTIKTLIVYHDETQTPSISYFESAFLNNIIGKKVEKEGDKSITGVIEIESNPNPTSDISIDEEITKIEANIKKLKEENNKLKDLTGVLTQSKTLENIMDYRQPIDATCEKPFNENFQYKLFYQWQWKEMLETGIENEYISEVK